MKMLPLSLSKLTQAYCAYKLIFFKHWVPILDKGIHVELLQWTLWTGIAVSICDYN